MLEWRTTSDEISDSFLNYFHNIDLMASWLPGVFDKTAYSQYTSVVTISNVELFPS